ncbi:MFS transporter [Burkholderia sp. WSM2232]|uniref:MFS transporter n=1 Tax=Burkholderia sp. WSM2232 TaxID=944436 RepID=UPI0004059C63|nr:MFS transporter [Burkholderia sp. WSM2232]
MKGKKGILVAIWLLQVVNYIDRVVLGFAGPAMMHTLHLNPQTFGVILSAFAVGYLVSQMPGGWLADRFGTRVVLVVAPLFWALLTGLTGLFTGVAILVLVRFAFGVSEGLSNPAIYKLVGDTFDERERAQAVAWWATAIAAAPALSGPLVGTLLTTFGWKMVFVMLAAPAIAIAVLNAALLPRKAEVARAVGMTEEARIPFRILAQQPALWLISGVFCFWNAAYWGLLGWMPSYLSLERHIDLKSAGLLGGIPYVFGVIGLIVTGWLGRGPMLKQRPQLLSGINLLGALCLFAAYYANTLPLCIAGLCGAAFCVYGGLGTYGTLVLDFAPKEARAAYAGIVATVGMIGSVLAPLVIGTLVKETGTFASGFGAMMGSLFIAGCCGFALVRHAPARLQTVTGA